MKMGHIIHTNHKLSNLNMRAEFNVMHRTEAPVIIFHLIYV